MNEMSLMYQEISKCPVCGKDNQYTAYSEWGIGTVEQHYYCDRCTYFVYQVYSPVYDGISTDCPEEYLDRVRELKLDVYKPEEIP